MKKSTIIKLQQLKVRKPSWFWDQIHNFLLRGVVFCARCGHRYTAEYHYNDKKLAKRGGKIAYYHCVKRTPCKAPYVEVEDLESKVADYFKNIKFSKGFTDRLVLRIRKYLKEKDREKAKARRSLLNKRNAIVGKSSVLMDRLLDNTVDRNTFTSTNAKLNEDIEYLDKQLSSLESTRKLDFDLLAEVLSLTRDIGSVSFQCVM